jgi:hypothetical protein
MYSRALPRAEGAGAVRRALADRQRRPQRRPAVSSDDYRNALRVPVEKGAPESERAVTARWEAHRLEAVSDTKTGSRASGPCACEQEREARPHRSTDPERHGLDTSRDHDHFRRHGSATPVGRRSARDVIGGVDDEWPGGERTRKVAVRNEGGIRDRRFACLNRHRRTRRDRATRLTPRCRRCQVVMAAAAPDQQDDAADEHARPEAGLAPLSPRKRHHRSLRTDETWRSVAAPNSACYEPARNCCSFRDAVVRVQPHAVDRRQPAHELVEEGLETGSDGGEDGQDARPAITWARRRLGGPRSSLALGGAIARRSRHSIGRPGKRERVARLTRLPSCSSWRWISGDEELGVRAAECHLDTCSSARDFRRVPEPNQSDADAIREPYRDGASESFGSRRSEDPLLPGHDGRIGWPG